MAGGHHSVGAWSHRPAPLPTDCGPKDGESPLCPRSPQSIPGWIRGYHPASSIFRTPPLRQSVLPPCAPARGPWSRKLRVPTVPGVAQGRSRLGSADTTPRAAPRPAHGPRSPPPKLAHVGGQARAGPRRGRCGRLRPGRLCSRPAPAGYPRSGPAPARTPQLPCRSPGPPAHLLDGLLRDLAFASRPGGRESHRHGSGRGISPRSLGFILRLRSAAGGAHSPQSLGGRGARGGEPPCGLVRHAAAALP